MTLSCILYGLFLILFVFVFALILDLILDRNRPILPYVDKQQVIKEKLDEEIKDLHKIAIHHKYIHIVDRVWMIECRECKLVHMDFTHHNCPFKFRALACGILGWKDMKNYWLCLRCGD